MKEVLDDIDRWRAAGRRVAVARVVGIEGSGPRLPGAAMAVSEDGEVAGSVSGGCVEGAVLEELQSLLAEPPAGGRLLTYGIADDDAFAVGLTCGGTVHIFIEALEGHSPTFEALLDALRDERSVAVATALAGAPAPPGAKLLVRVGEPPLGGLGEDDLDRVVARDTRAALASGLTSTRHYGRHGEARQRDVTVFVESFGPPPHMVIFGAVDFTGALVKVAKLLGYRVTVCDARPPFATYLRFPEADEVVVGWPDAYLAKVGEELGPRDAVCVLTHDPKFDVPAVIAALDTDVGYVGAMGSRRAHAERLARLEDAGVGGARLHRLMAPIGLDIGARTPEETAVAICAEIIALRTGRGGTSLRDREGPLHS